MQPRALEGRPTRLSRGFLLAGAITLAVLFVTGVALWQAHEIQEDTHEPPSWANSLRVIHGIFNPIACILFGYLMLAHIPIGWKMKANRSSGLVMTLMIGWLILSGTALYYSNARDFFFGAHLSPGFLLPAAMVWHIVAAKRWTKK